MSSRYADIPVKSSDSGIRYRGMTIYPEIELDEDDYYAIAEFGDRWDNLSLQFYNDADYWWVIAAANPTLSNGSLAVPVGAQVRIPAYPAKYCSEFKKLNNN